MGRFALLLVLLPAASRADVALPTVLASHMVIQRSVPVHLWGTSSAGEAVTANLGNHTRSTTADNIGNWSLYLPAMPAGGPFEVVVQGRNRIVLSDVLVGDVWVASGQSNMEFALKGANNASAELADANHPRIRLLRLKNKVADYPQPDAEVFPWIPCNPDSASDFSAVAYFFGRHLEAKLGIPIGLIDTSWGGTPAEAWTSLRALSADASLMPVFAEWARMTDDRAISRKQRDRQLEDWRQQVERAKGEGAHTPAFPWKANDSGEWSPAGLFNSMIAPLTPFPIKGAIWYQGESNASRERVGLYERLFRTMIEDWRRAWTVGDFPFLFVQLANFQTSASWPELREAQRLTLGLRNTGMAVTIDIGTPDDIHPRNKQDVGLRLALAARLIAYGEKVEGSGPLFERATPEGKSIRAYFTHAQGLVAKGGDLTGFEAAGADRVFQAADARIDGNSVVVTSTAVPAPLFVRYGWSATPKCNLYNDSLLPASPFRSF